MSTGEANINSTDADIAYARRNPVALQVPLKQALESRVFALALVIAFGTVLILPRLGTQSLWLDEGLTIGPALNATSAADLLARVRTVDTQPPASHALLWMLADVLPRTEFFFRLPSFVAVELGIVLLYVVTRRLWGPAIAIVVAACAQLSPYLAFYAAEARNYGLWFLCITASVLIALRWREAVRAHAWRQAWRWAAALAIVNALGLWIHIFHVFVLVAEVAIFATATLLDTKSWRDRAHALGSLVAAQVLASALFVPWLLVLWHAAREGTAGVPWQRPFTIQSLAYYLFAAHFGVSLGPDLRALHLHGMAQLVAAHPLVLVLAAVAIAATALTWVLLVGDALRIPARRWELLPLVAWPACAVAGPLAYAAVRDFPLHPRHQLLVWPLLPIILALGLVRYRRVRPLLLVGLVLQAVALGNLLFDAHYVKDDERGAVGFAEAHAAGVAYVLGDVAPLYVTRAQGRAKNFLAFPAGTNDVWLVDNRTWEPQNRRARARLKLKMRALGMRYHGGTTRFRGIVLRHWTATG